MAMSQSSRIEERTLYWLSLNTQVRALAERLLERFAVTVGGLPASAAHRLMTGWSRTRLPWGRDRKNFLGHAQTFAHSMPIRG
jgi:hypothetical protein